MEDNEIWDLKIDTQTLRGKFDAKVNGDKVKEVNNINKLIYTFTRENSRNDYIIPNFERKRKN